MRRVIFMVQGHASAHQFPMVQQLPYIFVGFSGLGMHCCPDAGSATMASLSTGIQYE
jgi:hypothetical protein